MILLLRGRSGALPSLRALLPFLFRPGSVLVLGRGIALRTSSRSGSCSGDERSPLSPDPATLLVFVSRSSLFVMGFFLLFCFLMALSVISVNVNGLRDGDKRLGFLQWLSHLSPSVVFLQETHTVSNDDLLSWFSRFGYLCAGSFGIIMGNMEHGRVTSAKSQLLEKTQSNLEFNFEFNRKENRLIWNGSVDDLEKFFKYINVMNGDDSILTVNTNAKRFMFKFSMATVNFFPTTKTLQIQGKSACDLRNKLIDYSNERNCSDNPAEFQAPNFVETLEDLEDSQYGLSELESFIDFAMEETGKDFPNSAVEETSKVFPNSVSNIGYGDEIKEIWKAIDVIYSKINVIIEEKSAFPSTSSTKSPEELLTIENLSSENDLLKGKLRERGFELQRTKEENLSLITALKLISNNLSEPTKTTDDNSPRSHNRSKLHFTSPAERCPLETSNPIEVPQEARENQSSSKSFDNQIDDYRVIQKNLYADRCSLQTSNPIEVPQEARENQSSSKSLDNQIDDYRAKQKTSYEEIKGSTGHRASKYDIPIISIDQQPSRTVHSITQPLKGATKETRKSEQSRKSKKHKSKLKIDSSADTIHTVSMRSLTWVRNVGPRCLGKKKLPKSQWEL